MQCAMHVTLKWVLCMAFAIKFITYIMYAIKFITYNLYYVCVGIWTHFCFLHQIEDLKN